MSDEEDFIFDEEELEEYMSDGDEIHEEDTTPEEEIREHMDFSTVVVAENLPKVPAAKFEKLKAFIINKAFNKAGSIVHDKLVVPQNKDGSTKGLVCIGRGQGHRRFQINKFHFHFLPQDCHYRVRRQGRRHQGHRLQ